MKIATMMKKLPVGFADEADAMDEESLRATIVTAEVQVQEIEKSRDEDETLTAAKEHVKDLASGYRDAVTAQRAKIAYALYRLGETGKLGVKPRKRG